MFTAVLTSRFLKVSSALPGDSEGVSFKRPSFPEANRLSDPDLHHQVLFRKMSRADRVAVPAVVLRANYITISTAPQQLSCPSRLRYAGSSTCIRARVFYPASALFTFLAFFHYVGALGLNLP